MLVCSLHAGAGCIQAYALCNLHAMFDAVHDRCQRPAFDGVDRGYILIQSLKRTCQLSAYFVDCIFYF